jgi:hypothetical protein
MYTITDTNNMVRSYSVKGFDSNARLWDITKDAKDGDVLAVESENDYPSPFIAIYKECGLNFFNSYCFISFDGKFNEGTTGHSIYYVHPATKEQRDTLMKAMADAGYTFDFEKKELKKVEPKFHEGDWIVHLGTENIYQVVAIIDNQYQLKYGDNYTVQKCTDVHKNFKLWDISDAKPGDVLVCKGNIKYSNGIKYKRICLFNNLDNAFFILTKISNCVEDYGIDVNIDYPDNTVPATKEQKEILFMAMKDAGYTFDFEKKELKKIEQKPVDKVEPKFKIGDTIKDPYGDTYHIIEIENDSYKSDDGRFILFTNEKFYTLFNPAWSEEDEKIINKLIAVVELYYGIGDDLDKQMCLSWLKFIKDRVAWKPSEEQMKALNDLNLTGCISYAGQGQELINLYNDLKKLKC